MRGKGADINIMRKDEFPIIDKHVHNEILKVLKEIKGCLEEEQYSSNYAFDSDYYGGYLYGLEIACQRISQKIGEIENE